MRVNQSEARVQLETLGAEIVAGVERCLPGWVERQVERILDAWDRLSPDERDRVRVEARAAGAAATERVAGTLRELLTAEPDAQAATPLQIVRSAYREPTAVLAAAGVPPVVRDEFDERAWPDDRYGLVPRDLGDLGDERLAPLHLAWGLAKSRAIRAQ